MRAQTASRAAEQIVSDDPATAWEQIVLPAWQRESGGPPELVLGRS